MKRIVERCPYMLKRVLKNINSPEWYKPLLESAHRGAAANVVKNKMNMNVVYTENLGDLVQGVKDHVQQCVPSGLSVALPLASSGEYTNFVTSLVDIERKKNQEAVENATIAASETTVDAQKQLLKLVEEYPYILAKVDKSKWEKNLLEAAHRGVAIDLVKEEGNEELVLDLNVEVFEQIVFERIWTFFPANYELYSLISLFGDLEDQYTQSVKSLVNPILIEHQTFLKEAFITILRGN